MNPQDKPVDPAQPQNNPPAQKPDPVSQDDTENAPANDSLNQQQFTEISLPTEAQDSDLIEKEWVERAKQIVEHTREDPYEQLRALSHMKADYLKKRYNKDIKITDE